MIDSHCHLDCCSNIDEIIKSFDGIIITSGYDDKSNLKVIELVNKYSNVYGTLGIHPEEVDNKYDIDIITKNINNSKIIGIGEIGLDYHYTSENKDRQINLFKLQLDIATKYNLPIVVHSRDAILDTYNILSSYKLKGTIHCFSSSLEMAKKFIDLGYKIGVGGVVTFKNGKKLREIVRKISLNDILTETDSPYLSPEPFRGKENNSGNIKYILDEIVKIKKCSYEEAINTINNNCLSTFNIK